MKHLNTNILNNTLVLLILATFTFTACDTTGANDDLEDHQDAIGFVLQERTVFDQGGDEEILRSVSGDFTWNPDGEYNEYFRQDIDGIVISPDVIDLTEEIASGMTPKIIIRWIDLDGDIFDLPDLDEDEGGEYWLLWEWRNPHTDPPSPHDNTLTVECTDEAREDVDALNDIRPANLEQHGSDGMWGFHFRADHAGETQLRFRIMHGHGDDAHSDFTSAWMDVTVPHDDHNLIDENGIYQHTRDKCRTR